MFRIAIVGRPNVGKSALFNRLARRTVSIVHDQPGVTRDRISALVNRGGVRFELIDTGGIGLFESANTPGKIAEAVRMQVDLAIETADLILFVVDGLEGSRPLDAEVIAKLRKSGKKIWLLVNKLDLPMHDVRAADFSNFGIDPTLCVSASHSRGIDRLWEAIEKAERGARCVETEGEAGEIKTPAEKESRPKVAVVGRPNVGKSSLVNRLLSANRVIVSEIPGTTRDSVELPVEFDGKSYCIVDTAGIRHKSSIRTHVEMYSRHWTEKSVARSDLVLLMLSAPEGATRQDKEIAGMILEYRKPCIILVNKWDLNETVEEASFAGSGARRGVRKKRRLLPRSEYEKELRYQMPFLDYAEVMFVSALQGYHALKIWKEIGRVLEAAHFRFTTGVLNRIFSRCQERVQPPMKEGKRLKIYYVTQKAEVPIPTFVVFVNQRRLWSDSYERYLKNQLREEKALTGCPILFVLREHAGQALPRSSRAQEEALDEG